MHFEDGADFAKPARRGKRPVHEPAYSQEALPRQVPTQAGPADLTLDAGVITVPLSQIEQRPDLFQNRADAFSKRTFDNIVEEARAGTFRWANLDAITLWVEPGTGKYVILSGHSRYASFEACHAEGLTAEGRDFSAIPAKLFVGTLSEAQALAKASNTLSTKETDTERAVYYRHLIDTGTPKKAIVEAAKKAEGRNANFILNLAVLSPTGQALGDVLLLEQSSEGQNGQIIRTLADWIGEARRRFPDLNASHESELYRWLQKMYDKPGFKNKAEFKDKVDRAVNVAVMNGGLDQPLNPENRSGKSVEVLEYEAEIEAHRRDMAANQKRLDKARKELIAMGESRERINKILLPIEDEIRGSQRKIIELENLRTSVKAGGRLQMSLFGLGQTDLSDYRAQAREYAKILVGRTIYRVEVGDIKFTASGLHHLTGRTRFFDKIQYKALTVILDGLAIGEYMGKLPPLPDRHTEALAFHYFLYKLDQTHNVIYTVRELINPTHGRMLVYDQHVVLEK